MILLLVGKLLEILPIGGSSVKLTGYKLILGFIGMVCRWFSSLLWWWSICSSSSNTFFTWNVSYSSFSDHDNC